MAEHRHKRETTARRKPRAALVAAPLALMATASAVSLGVFSADPGPRDLVASDAAAGSISTSTTTVPPRQPVSRSNSRLDALKLKVAAERTATLRAVRQADEKRWTTTTLNLWSDSGNDAERLGEIETGEKVLVTGRTADGRVEIVVNGKSRWVTAGYLSEDKPVEGIGGECTNGTTVAPGVSPNVVKVHEAVCAAFPDITTYGTFRSDGEHGQGIAVDIMVSGERGWQVAEFIRENYAELGVSYLIYSQQIWSVEQAGAGWRGMSDRGSATANHFDHVHVTTY